MYTLKPRIWGLGLQEIVFGFFYFLTVSKAFSQQFLLKFSVETMSNEYCKALQTSDSIFSSNLANGSITAAGQSSVPTIRRTDKKRNEAADRT
jgi:hypothetical protein